MAEIVLTPEQIEIYRRSNSPVRVKDSTGTVLGILDPALTPEYIAELKRRAREGPWVSGEHVQRMLKFLDEAWEREGPFDKSRMRQLLAEFKSKAPECNPGR
jgi:hypothetical protein